MSSLYSRRKASIRARNWLYCGESFKWFGAVLSSVLVGGVLRAQHVITHSLAPLVALTLTPLVTRAPSFAEVRVENHLRLPVALECNPCTHDSVSGGIDCYTQNGHQCYLTMLRSCLYATSL